MMCNFCAEWCYSVNFRKMDKEMNRKTERCRREVNSLFFLLLQCVFFFFLIPGLPFLGLGGVFDVAVGLALGLCCWSLVLGPGSVILVLWSLSLVFLVLVFGFFYTLLMCIATALP